GRERIVVDEPRALVSSVLLVFVVRFELGHLQQEPVVVRVVEYRQSPRMEQRINGLFQRELGLIERRGLERHLGEQLEDRLRKEHHLLLLDDHGDELVTGTGLQVEGPHPRLAERIRGDPIHGSDLHDGYPRSFPRRRRPPSAAASHGATAGSPNRSSPPVSFASTTRRWLPSITTTETDAVSMTIRWKSSSGVPSRWASTMRTMSPCVATATRPCGCLRAIRSTATTARASASTKPSPPGNRNREGSAWTTRHSLVRRTCASVRPVHDPVSISIRAGASETRSRLTAASGSTVWVHRSSGLE